MFSWKWIVEKILLKVPVHTGKVSKESHAKLCQNKFTVWTTKNSGGACAKSTNKYQYVEDCNICYTVYMWCVFSSCHFLLPAAPLLWPIFGSVPCSSPALILLPAVSTALLFSYSPTTDPGLWPTILVDLNNPPQTNKLGNILPR